MTENEERIAVVAEARTWINTPYHPRARVKGAGIDCAYLLVESFANAGVMDPIDLGKYSIDWHLHRNEEKYLEVVEEHAKLVDEYPDGIPDTSLIHADPGDLIVWKFGKTYSHGAIVTEWPRVVHASLPSRIVEEIDVSHTPLAALPAKRYSHWRAE